MIDAPPRTCGGVPDRWPARGAARPSPGITVYGCADDEREAFTALGPRFGVVPTIVGAAPSASSIIAVPGNRCASVGHRSAITAGVLRALRGAGVEHLSTRSSGLDHIDLEAASQLGITVGRATYAPDGVADFALMLILMAVRGAQRTMRSVQERDFTLGSVRGKDLRDLTVGIVGMGAIGTAVAARLAGFGCRILAHSSGTTTAPATAAPADVVALDELLIESDVVTLHVPLDGRTRHLIGRRQLEMMKVGAFLVNTGRGALVDTDALITALEGGRLGGAALDVLEGEEGLFGVDCTARPIDHPFLPRLQALPNVIVTPHTAYFTERALRDTVENTLADCSNYERKRADAETQDRHPVRGIVGGT